MEGWCLCCAAGGIITPLTPHDTVLRLREPKMCKGMMINEKPKNDRLCESVRGWLLTACSQARNQEYHVAHSDKISAHEQQTKPCTM